MLYFERIDVSKELMLIKPANQQMVIFITIGIFKLKPYVCNSCHDLLMMSMTFSDVAIIKMKNANSYYFYYLILLPVLANVKL